MKLKMNGMRLAPLPPGKTAVDVFGDFLGYLFRCTRAFVADTHANGHALWRAVEPELVGEVERRRVDERELDGLRVGAPRGRRRRGGREAGEEDV